MVLFPIGSRPVPGPAPEPNGWHTRIEDVFAQHYDLNGPPRASSGLSLGLIKPPPAPAGVPKRGISDLPGPAGGPAPPVPLRNAGKRRAACAACLESNAGFAPSVSGGVTFSAQRARQEPCPARATISKNLPNAGPAGRRCSGSPKTDSPRRDAGASQWRRVYYPATFLPDRPRRCITDTSEVGTCGRSTLVFSTG